MKIRTATMAGLLTAHALFATEGRAQQVESAINCPEGTPPIPVAYGAHTVDCLIDTIADIDTFAFDGTDGDLVRIVVAETTTTTIELRLQVRDPSGVVVLEAAPGTNIRETFTLADTGLHAISISENGANETGGYRLQLERIPPPISPPVIAINTSVSDAIDHRADHDFWVFCASENDDVRVSLAETTTTLIELRLEVWDPAGSSIINTAPGINIGVDIPLPATGCYLAGVSENGQNERGGYEFGVQCLFGMCLNTADLSISKSGAPDPVARGGDLVYTITVTNQGPTDAANVIVNDLLPADIFFVSTTGCLNDPDGFPDCELGTIANGASGQYQIATIVGANASGTITNQATVRSTTTEGVPGDETAFAQTEVSEDDLIFGDGFES